MCLGVGSMNVEGTGFDGEENDNDNDDIKQSEFYEWMVKQNAKHKLIIKCIKNDIDTMYVIHFFIC